MVMLNKIYTRKGDDGTTALADGTRRHKDDARIESYGAIDEANATIGIARLHTSDPIRGGVHKTLDDILLRLQNDLFDLGADLATPVSKEKAKKKSLRIQPQQVERLEQEIDMLNKDLAPLTSFILSGGSAAAAHLHLARTIIRRAERVMSAVHKNKDKDDALSPEARQFINRASDLLFVAARIANANEGVEDVLWQPHGNIK
ncbi:MAG: cob(I)yrinic acid a,c-diamide adenosyltransferase [Alphaproteobacteria bacterium]|nr:cob(I)yrinic acid a,c-diamide adenosyltransferase [Alphaproteobacteria bacterium]MBE8220494.1 cob(I)yrinic acid a,c-diamide adenosyltransferase [Alphaproteobacteria bacterium]